MNEPTTSIREALEAAIETPSSAPAPAPLEPAAPASAPAAQAADSTPVPAAGQELSKLAEGEKQGLQQRDRDEQGRFKPKAAEPLAEPEQPEQQPAEGITPGPKAGPKVQQDRAPQSWRPDVREHWAQLPEPVRAEIQRREGEHQRVLQDTAEARKGYEAVMRVVQPYEAFIRAENSNPVQAIDNLMSTAARLRTGTAPEIAQMVAGIVSQFGIGRFGNTFIEMLDGALAGQTPQQDPQQLALQQALDQRLAPLQSMFQQFQQAQQAQQQRVVQQAQSEVEQFLTRAEFGNDVREEMADLIEAAQRRGQDMTIQDAYKKACMLNDNVRAVLQQRARANGAQQQTQAAQRARAAAVSVSGSAPMGALRQEPTDVRSAIEAALAQTSR
jgi:hypothetical protein